eukprot:COSAG01_NODE_7492_length_3186_cov_1.931973_1_plen_97_part_10
MSERQSAEICRRSLAGDPLWLKISGQTQHRSQNFTLCCAIEQFPTVALYDARCDAMMPSHFVSSVSVSVLCPSKRLPLCLCHSVPLYVCVKLCCTIY